MDLALGKLVRERLGGDAGDSTVPEMPEESETCRTSFPCSRNERKNFSYSPVPMAAVLVSAPSFIA